jgi:hypothetical protein
MPVIKSKKAASTTEVIKACKSSDNFDSLMGTSLQRAIKWLIMKKIHELALRGN